jgi:hypothetical protein
LAAAGCTNHVAVDRVRMRVTELLVVFDDYVDFLLKIEPKRDCPLASRLDIPIAPLVCAHTIPCLEFGIQ